MSKVTKPMGVTRHTAMMILLYLEAVNRPARTSEVRGSTRRSSSMARSLRTSAWKFGTRAAAASAAAS
jgi:hypothetical protein